MSGGSKEEFRGGLRGFRERFLPILSEAEHETIHPDLYSELIDGGTDIIIQRLKDYNERRKNLLRDLRGKIAIKRFAQDERAAHLRTVASDAGNNGADFRSAFIPLYASAAICAEGWTIIDEPIYRAGEPQIWPDEFRSHERESLLASKLQFEVTLEAIERWNPRCALLDGPLLINFWLLPSIFGSTREYEEDFESTIDRLISLLLTCYERDIPVVGFVKRTRMNDICTELGAPKMRDTALLDLVLNLGEYTVPKPISNRNIVLNKYRESCRRMGIPENYAEDFLSIYFSYVKTGFTTPFRIEMPKYCLDRLDEVGALIFTTSEEENGIPFIINEVDNITKITTAVSNIRTLMIYSKALDLVRSGELSPEDLNLLALQHGEPWALRDGERLKTGM